MQIANLLTDTAMTLNIGDQIITVSPLEAIAAVVVVFALLIIFND